MLLVSRVHSKRWPCAAAAAAAAATVPAALSLASLKAPGIHLSRCVAAWKHAEIFLPSIIPYFYLALRLLETNTGYLVKCLV